MADFAELGIRFLPVGDAEAERAFKAVTTGAESAETATKRMTATQESAARTQRAMAEANRLNVSALGQMAQAIQAADAQQRAAMKTTAALSAEVKRATVSFGDFYDAAERDFASQYVRSMTSVTKAHVAGVGSSKAMSQATLNLSRQFADVGVTAAMGMSPLMILIQQGPQVADGFAMAAAQGVTFKDVLIGIRTQALALLAAWGPLIAAGAALAGAVYAISEAMKASKLSADNAAKSAHDYAVAMQNARDAIGGVVVATYKLADARKEAARASLEELRASNQKEINRLENPSIATRVGRFIGTPFTGAPAALLARADEEQAARLKAQNASMLAEGIRLAMSDKLAVDSSAKAHVAASGAVRGHSAALRDYSKAAKEALDRTAPLTADLSKMVNLDAPASTKGFERTLKEINGELKTLPDITAKAVDVMEAFYAAANDAAGGVGQLFGGLKNRDWTSAVSGLLRAAKAIKEAFGKGGTTEGKIGAIAGIADGIGQAVGGTAGSVLSGAAGGAMGGVSLALALGGPVGWIAAAGAAIGGLFGLFGSNSKKQAEKEAARQAAAEKEAQRQADIANQRREIELNIVALSGDAVATLAAQREAELAGIDESNKALARQMYALQDAKKITDERTALEVRYMQATGDEAGILAKARAEEIKGIDATNRALLDLVYAQEDYAGRLAGAKTDLAAAYEREAAAIQTTQDKFAGLAKTLREFGDSLDPANQAGGGSYGAARFKFLKTASGTDAESLAGIPDAGRAFIAASAANSRTLLAFQRDVATVRNATRAAENSAMSQASIAEQQLAGIKAQVSGLITLNDSVLSLPAAIAALLAVQATAPTATPASVAPTGPSATSPNWTSYLNRYADVMAWAQSGHGDPTKPIDGQTLEDRAKYHYYNSGMTEGRTPFATGGSFTVGGMGGVDSQNFGPIALSPGEVVNVRRPGAANDEDMAGALSALAAEVAALRQDVRAGNANTKKTADILTRVTPNGDTLLTEAA